MADLKKRAPISVVIPVYNAAAYVVAALESVVAQSLWPVEIIVVDDGSTDDSAARVARFAQSAPLPVRLLRQENQGNAVAKNVGIAAAQGEFLAFLDADDLWLPGKLAQQMAALQDDPARGYVLCHMRARLEPGTQWPAHLNRTHYAQDPLLYAPSALLARRGLFESVGDSVNGSVGIDPAPRHTVGLFDADYQFGNDGDWFLRARDAQVLMTVVPAVLVEKRIHGTNVTHQTATMNRELFRGLRASLHRRRTQPDTPDAPAALSCPPVADTGADTGATRGSRACLPITVIIPVYNGARYIAAALASVLAQTVPPQRVIVVDDGSTDDTRAAVAPFILPAADSTVGPASTSVHYCFQPNQGASAAINHGVAQATTDFLAFLDADDLWEPAKLAQQWACFLDDPTREAVFGHVRQFVSPEIEEDAARKLRYGREVVAGHSLTSMLIRCASWARIGPLDPAIKAGFVEWLPRAQQMGLRTIMLEAVVALRRIHDTNVSIRDRGAVQSDYFRILKNNLDRRRKSE
ncbi:MAG: glycosyltransferase [Litorilinea sp.]